MSKRRNDAAAATAPKSERQDPLSLALNIAKNREAALADDERNGIEHNVKVYCRLLLGWGVLPPDEIAKELDGLIWDLKLTPAAIQADLARISAYRDHLSAHARRCDADAKLIELANARRALEKRQPRDMEAAKLAERRARSQSSICNNAGNQIALLESTHPHLAAAFASLRSAT